ncbi:MAG TPA: hypothetical protein VEV44_03790 [Pseudoneobacillus sp.]|nr:hypothetical protein [Pseudoneobacillus sp.]
MKKYIIPVTIFVIIIAFYLQLLGLMNLIPFFVSAPILFLSFLLLLTSLNSRKRFRGFK